MGFDFILKWYSSPEKSKARLVVSMVGEHTACVKRMHYIHSWLFLCKNAEVPRIRYQPPLSQSTVPFNNGTSLSLQLIVVHRMELWRLINELPFEERLYRENRCHKCLVSIISHFFPAKAAHGRDFSLCALLFQNEVPTLQATPPHLSSAHLQPRKSQTTRS